MNIGPYFAPQECPSGLPLTKSRWSSSDCRCFNSQSCVVSLFAIEVFTASYKRSGLSGLRFDPMAQIA
jgi:hypothetical protein